MRPLTDMLVIEQFKPDSPEALRLALAMAGRILSDFGATVLRIQPRDQPVFMPALNTEDGITSSHEEAFLNAGKPRVLASDDALAMRADIVLTDDNTLDRAHADQIVVLVKSVPGGHALEGKRVSELCLMAQSGLLDMVGEPDREPLMLAGHQPAYAAGLAAFAATAAGIAARQSGLGGDIYTVCALDVLAWINWKSLASHLIGESGSCSREGPSTEWPVLPCRDGWVVLAFTRSDWHRVVDMVGVERLRSPEFETGAGRAARRAEYIRILRKWSYAMTRAEIQLAATTFGLPVAVVLDAHEVISDPHNVARGVFEKDQEPGALAQPVLPLRWNGERFLRRTRPENASALDTRCAPATAPSVKLPSPDELPLSGFRVLDLGILTAGAGTSALLADAGAHVIKVESSRHPDPFRGWSDVSADEARTSIFSFSNRNKDGVELDLKSAEGRETFLRLVERSDIVVENFRRGVLENLGLSFETLRQRNPAIVLASISSQGETGPDSKKPSYGSTLEALSGMASACGYAGEGPQVSGRNVNYPDQVVSLFAMGAVTLAALSARRNGVGVHLDIPQRDVASFLIGDRLMAAQAARTSAATRSGNSSLSGHLQGCFKSVDGQWIAVTVPDGSIRNGLAGLLGSSDVDEKTLRSWIASKPSADALATLQQLGASAATVANNAAVCEALAGTTASALSRAPNEELLKGFPFQSARTPFVVRKLAPRLGEDTATVLHNVLGESARGV